jgi:Tol biopolymer transport system component
MTFNIGIGSTLIASSTDDGIPYLWKSGDITTTPSNETKITASDAAAGDSFGWSVAVGSGRIVVGASGDDDNGSSSGSAYIFDLDGNQLSKITASDGAATDVFGRTAAVGCGRIVVSAPQDQDAGNQTGSAYIYDLDGNQLTKITASDAAADDRFGTSAAVGCGRIVVGAYFDDDNGSNSGSAYIFDLDGNQLTKITASDGATNDNFGYSVAVGCGRIVIGASGDAGGTGSTYIFDLDGNQLSKITASDGAFNDRFGSSVAVGCGRIVIGATLDDDNGDASGSGYIFDLDGTQLAKITASDGAAYDQFGNSVAVGSGRIVFGVYADDDNGSSSGSAYIYDLDGTQLAKITASDAAADDRFGWSVAVGSGRIVVGAYLDDDNGSGSGSAYIYETPQVYTLYDAIDMQSVGITTL